MTTAERLAAFGPPRWRTPAELIGGELRTIEEFFRDPPLDVDLLIAESDAGVALGFIYLEEQQDYFTLERHGHVGIIAVSAEAEGQGAGKALMTAADAWALARGYRKLTLNVFEHNRRARDVYEHCGFEADTIKYLKVLHAGKGKG